MEALDLGREGVLQFDLTRGFVALVDADRFESTLTYHFQDGREATLRPSSVNWCASKSKCRFYACAFFREGGVRWGMKLHRLLIEAPSNFIVDHINNDTMDNRIRNLRLCSLAENRCNSRKIKPSTSQFKGVKRTPLGRFTATIRNEYLGTFDGEEAAARAYDRAAIEHFGEFARLNFPQEAQ